MQLALDLELDGTWIRSLEIIKLKMQECDGTGIAADSGLGEVLCACADVGVAALHRSMEASGEWERFAREVDLGMEADAVLSDGDD